MEFIKIARSRDIWLNEQSIPRGIIKLLLTTSRDSVGW